MTIGILGAGIVGSGVAHCAAQAGMQVILSDADSRQWERAQKSIAEICGLQKMLKMRPADQCQAEDIISRISFTDDIEKLAEADFVIEAISELEDVKREVLNALDRICPPTVRFASTTSAIPITRLASFTTRANLFVGLHFMNPVPLKPMVEMIRGYHTSEETLEQTKELLKAMGKKAVLVNDSPGFVSNRVLMLTVNEAIWLVQDRVASPRDIDAIFKGCFGHKMGPLETADMIGLDTILQSLQVLVNHFGDPKYRPCPLLAQMVDAGLLGRKSGEGFFKYNLRK
ncbi:3-hydroxybutyryl-CoA dehydrogenase [bacterium]|nr:3-hydroxybutyryl-CoA dehydrogenase [bacterium]